MTVVAALLLVLGACGADSEDESSAEETGATMTETQQPEQEQSAGAEDDGPPPGSLDGATDLSDLVGRTLVVTEMERDGKPHSVVDRTQIRFNFAEKRVSVETGCNTLSGSWERVEDTLTFGQMMGTMIGCEPELAAQEEMLSKALDAPFVVERDTFVAGDVTFHLVDRETVSPDLDLAGPRWHLEALVDDTAVSSVPGGVKAWLEYDRSTLEVNAGCNRGRGSAERDGDTLVVRGIGLTRKACQGDRGEVERHVLAVLSGKVHVAVREQTLTLTGADGRALVLTADAG